MFQYQHLMIILMVLVYAITLSRGAYILVEVDSAHVSAPLRKTSVKHRPSMKKSFRFFYNNLWINIYTVWPEPIWIKVKSWWQILPQHQSTYLRGPEYASIEIPPFRPHFIKFSKTVFYEVNLTSQQSHLEVLLLSKFWSERGNFNWYRFWAS